MSERYLEGRVAMVTGGASGMGRAMAFAFAAAGADVGIGSLLGDSSAMKAEVLGGQREGVSRRSPRGPRRG